MSIEDNIKAANDGEIWAMEALAKDRVDKTQRCCKIKYEKVLPIDG